MPATDGDSGFVDREQLEAFIHLERARIVLVKPPAGQAIFSSDKRPEVRGALDFSDSRNGAYLLGVQVKKLRTGERSLPVAAPIAVLRQG